MNIQVALQLLTQLQLTILCSILGYLSFQLRLVLQIMVDIYHCTYGLVVLLGNSILSYKFQCYVSRIIPPSSEVVVLR